jgi:hypothetical protein
LSRDVRQVFVKKAYELGDVLYGIERAKDVVLAKLGSLGLR